MISYNLDPSGVGLKSESQGGYSYTKADTINGYPADLVKAFESVTVVRPVYGQKLSAYNDKRGMTAAQVIKAPVTDYEPGLPI
jgi:hypothetical protein